MPLDLLPDDLQRAIVDAAHDLLDPVTAAAMLRARAAGAVRDAGVWDKAAAQGWFGLTVPEEAGGLGLGTGGLALIHHGLGRTLTAGPYVGTAVAATVAHLADSRLLGDVMSGLPVGLLTADGPVTVGARVTGTFRTDDREDAQSWLALCPTGAALLTSLPPAAMAATPDSMDPGVRPALVTVDLDADAHVVGPRAWTLATLLVAAQLAGIAQAAVSGSVAHTSVREQFGRPIGGFQMVQQRCADMATRAEAATQLCLLAALSATEADAAQLSASALLIASDAAISNARDDIQNHGGMGFTWEVDSHLRLRRAHGLRALLGDPGDVRNAVLAGAAARAW
jgi:alkylation response protein AidB-like acyl-CoA dehydrogenase